MQVPDAAEDADRLVVALHRELLWAISRALEGPEGALRGASRPVPGLFPVVEGLRGLLQRLRNGDLNRGSRPGSAHVLLGAHALQVSRQPVGGMPFEGKHGEYHIRFKQNRDFKRNYIHLHTYMTIYDPSK